MGRKLHFFLNAQFVEKKQHFKNCGEKQVANNLITLTEKEKQKANGYGAIIVLKRK